MNQTSTNELIKKVSTNKIIPDVLEHEVSIKPFNNDKCSASNICGGYMS